MKPMERGLNVLVAAIAVAVALLMPATDFYVAYRSTVSILDTEAEINAAAATTVVHANPELWRYASIRLEDLLHRRPSDGSLEVRAIVEMDGRPIAESRDPLEAPLIRREALIHDGGLPVARLQITRSLRPDLIDSLWIAMFSILLSGAAFVGLRLLPLRALHAAQARLEHLSQFDELTGLPNRALFRDRLQHAMRRAKRENRSLAMMALGLDRFKTINESLGHETGDRLLRHVADLLARCIRDSDSILAPSPIAQGAGRDGDYMLSRLGGDQFAIIVENVVDPENAAAIARRILAELGEPLTIDGAEIFLSASIGLSMFPADDVDIDQLVRRADLALARSKELGSNGYQFFNPAMNARIHDRLSLETDLRHALDRGEFQLHYQPQVDCRSGRLLGVEALIRWNRPGRGLVPPDRFIPALEETGLIVAVGEWVIATACRQLAAWDAAGLPPLGVAVNLSARQFRQADLADSIEGALRLTGLAPARLELELTESLLMLDDEMTRNVMGELKRTGVRIAIDDFGTGHSSLAYLKRFDVDTLKIDRSFVRDVDVDADNRAIAAAIVALAHSLKLSVVAEGVEKPEQLAVLRELGCDSLQGYLVSRPQPAAALADFLAECESRDAADGRCLVAGLVAGPVPPAATPASAPAPADVRPASAGPTEAAGAFATPESTAESGIA